MRITFVTRKFGNVERNSHCDVLHIAPVRVANLVLDCNGVLAIKAYRAEPVPVHLPVGRTRARVHLPVGTGHLSTKAE